MRRWTSRRLCHLGLAMATVGVISASSGAAGASVPVAESTTFAGYFYQGGGPLAHHTVKVKATITVPALHCGKSYRAIAASTGIHEGPDGVQFPTSVIAGLFIGCYGGHAHFWPALLIGNTSKDFSGGGDNAEPGDTVTLEAVAGASTSRVVVTDTTRNFTATLNGAGAAYFASPYVGDNAWSTGKVVGVPNFGRLTFGSCTLFGTALGGASSLAGDRRVTTGGTVQISLGKLSSTGRKFSTTFEHA